MQTPLRLLDLRYESRRLGHDNVFGRNVRQRATNTRSDMLRALDFIVGKIDAQQYFLSRKLRSLLKQRLLWAAGSEVGSVDRKSDARYVAGALRHQKLDGCRDIFRCPGAPGRIPFEHPRTVAVG